MAALLTAGRHHSGDKVPFDRRRVLSQGSNTALPAHFPPLPPNKIPKVALLIMSQGPMPLERIWTEFLGGTIGPWQRFFSIYAHPTPSRPSGGGPSLFAGRTPVAADTAADPSTHAAAEAARALLRTALQDPMNAVFVLVPADAIPLYSAVAVWAQFMSEDKSRINLCAGEGIDRALDRIPKDIGAGVNATTWRRSAPWWSLRRAHAELVAKDEEVNAAFAKNCNAPCASWEHYIPTVLNLRGAAGGAVCDGEATGTVWERQGTAAPKERVFGKADAAEGTLNWELRRGAACPGVAQVEAATPKVMDGVRAAVVQLLSESMEGDKLTPAGVDKIARAAGAPRLGPKCPMFGRVIDGAAVEEWAALLRGLGLTHSEVDMG